jgi:hypothetical protein
MANGKELAVSQEASSSMQDREEEIVVSQIMDTWSLTNLSPMKESAHSQQKYFHGRISDRASSKRFVSFNSTLLPTLTTACNELASVRLKNCSVKRSVFNSDELEIVMNQKSDVIPSAKKFKLSESEEKLLADRTTTLSNLTSLSVNQLINVSVKVLKLFDSAQINVTGKKLLKEESQVADATGITRLVVWEGNVGKLMEGKSYSLTNVRIRQFKNESYLSLTTDSVINEIEDIGEVIEQEDEESKLSQRKNNRRRNCINNL